MGELANGTAAAPASAAEGLRELKKNLIAYRRSIGNGRSIVVERQLMGQARICIGADRNDYYDDFWDYGDVNEAVAEAILWDPRSVHEPRRWERHHKTGRRRPGGCAALEYVAS